MYACFLQADEMEPYRPSGNAQQHTRQARQPLHAAHKPASIQHTGTTASQRSQQPAAAGHAGKQDRRPLSPQVQVNVAKACAATGSDRSPAWASQAAAGQGALRQTIAVHDGSPAGVGSGRQQQPHRAGRVGMKDMQELEQQQAELLAGIMGTDFYEENDLLAAIVSQEREFLAGLPQHAGRSI